MADYTPLFKPGAAVTFQVSADVTAGQVVEITGDRTVAPAAADSAKAVGVAGFDATVGNSVTVFSGGVQRPAASGAIAAGDQVHAAAAGKVATGDSNVLGVALATAEDGDPVQIKFNA